MDSEHHHCSHAALHPGYQVLYPEVILDMWCSHNRTLPVLWADTVNKLGNKAEDSLLLGVFVHQKTGDRYLGGCTAPGWYVCMVLSPMDTAPSVPAGPSTWYTVITWPVKSPFLLCVFECDKEEPKITHIGRNVTMETRRQFNIVWSVLTQLL